ncbi:Stp1/IreP family PP2C-type Ser/Thr phosphatase [soil metagenome]
MTLRGHALTVQAFGATHTGRVRTGNEDSFLIADAVFAVADGMGGHQAGEIASDAALEPLREVDVLTVTDPADVSELLATAVREANALVVERASKDPQLEGMGTTLTAVAVRDGHLHVAHVGDSRAYLLRDNEDMSQLTTDHTLVERLVQEGRLSRDEAASHPQRNVITRAIGHESSVEVEVLSPIMLRDGDQILLCSDGLSGPVTDERIAATMSAKSDGDEAVTQLLAHANAAGGPDNITAVLVRVGEKWSATSVAAVDADANTTQPLVSRPDAPTEPDSEPAAGDDGAGDADDGPQRISIDTTPPSTDEPWAQRMRRIGAGGRSDPADDGARRVSAGRIVAVLLALAIIAAIIVGGGWLVLSRSYFVGTHDGVVAVFRGVPQPILGVSASRVLAEEITSTRVDAFPAFRQQAIADGLPAQNLDDARRIVDDLQTQLRESQPSPDVGEPLVEPSQSVQGP